MAEEDTAYDNPIAKVEELYERTDYSRNLDAVHLEKMWWKASCSTAKGILYSLCISGHAALSWVSCTLCGGVCIKPQEFKENADGTYTADVLDHDGHASGQRYIKTCRVGFRSM